MSSTPSIQIEKIDYGPFPEAPRLNPKLSPELPLLLATLVIAWEPDDARQAIARLEDSLMAFSPRFRDHECRGAEIYHVFRGAPPNGARPEGSAPGRGASVDAARNGYHPRLALAHLLEHALIDFQCSVTGLRRCSGATALRSNGHERIDVLVECPDPRAGRCCLALAMTWLAMALEGFPPGREERHILDAAGVVFRDEDGTVTATDVSRRLRIAPVKAERALVALAEIGYVAESAPWNVHVSGLKSWALRDHGPANS